MAVASNKLGQVALRRGDPAEARRHFERSYAVYQEIGDAGGLTEALQGLGNAAAAGGDYAAAGEWFRQALATVSRPGFDIYLASLLVSVGEMAIRAGRPDEGRHLLALALRHPAATQHVRDRARRHLPSAEAAGRQDPDTAPDSPGDDSQALVALMLDVVAELGAGAAPAAPAASPPAPTLAPPVPAAQGLIEPLSERELEVLRLLAEGRSNREIAETLIIAVGTVKTHVHNICGKLEAPTRGRAVARAQALGLLTPS
jgi:DNA-binding CsgD family transcriptional regulator